MIRRKTDSQKKTTGSSTKKPDFKKPTSSAKKDTTGEKNVKTSFAKKDSAGEKNVNARDKRKYIEFKQRVKKGDPLPSFNEDVS